MQRSKLSETDLFKKKEKPAKQSEHITKSFRLTKEQAEKLKEYTESIAPKHLLITEADIIRYMIENFDVNKAKDNFFKVKTD